jgi:small-conductance mechanosensitive channel
MAAGGLFNPQDLDELVVSLTKPGALAELGVLFVCLLAAWLVVRLLRGKEPRPDSVLFGARVIDGVLFPVLALAFAFAARLGLETMIKPAVFRVAIPILVSLFVIRLTVRILTRALPALHWVRIVERSVSWLAWIAVVLWVTGVLPSVLDAMDDVKWKMGATKVSLRNVVEGTITAGIVLMIALWISAVLERRLLRNATGHDLSLRKIAATLLRTVLLFVGLMFALSSVGIDLTALSVLGGALAVGLGFGLQKIAANYVSGFVILAERSISIGDMVKVDNFEGQVSDIRTRYTVIRALNGREAIIPNETLITTRVENSSLADRSVLMQTTLSVAYGTDVRKLQPVLQGAVAALPRVIDKPAPSVQMSAFTASSIELTVNFWIADPEAGQGNVKSEVNLAVLDVLRAEKIVFPSAQQTVLALVSKDAGPSVELVDPAASAEAATSTTSDPTAS